MSSPWIAAAVAVFAWWISTGVILFVVHRVDECGTSARRAIVFLSAPVASVGFLMVQASLDVMSVANVYLSFLGALLVWGWIELSFLTGYVTGPNRKPLLLHSSPASRFRQAVSAVAFHEALLLAGLVTLVAISMGSENRIGMACFLVLFIARIMAKLNLFFGVPRINTEFIPSALSHLTSYFRKGPITFAFPVAITVLTALLAVCAERLLNAQSDVTVVGFGLLTALTALALLEHWLMVVPLPDAKLWRWLLPPSPAIPEEESKTHGF